MGAHGVVVFGGFCARTDAVVQKSYLGWVPICDENCNGVTGCYVSHTQVKMVLVMGISYQTVEVAHVQLRWN